MIYQHAKHSVIMTDVTEAIIKMMQRIADKFTKTHKLSPMQTAIATEVGTDPVNNVRSTGPKLASPSLKTMNSLKPGSCFCLTHGRPQWQ